MHRKDIWVVIANEHSAAVHASRDGASVLLHRLDNTLASGDAADRSRCGFACVVMLELCRAAIAGDFAGLILVAGEEMMTDLHYVMTDNVQERVVASLVETVPGNAADYDWKKEGNFMPVRDISRPGDGGLAENIDRPVTRVR
jgi:hypothetical protein